MTGAFFLFKGYFCGIYGILYSRLVDVFLYYNFFNDFSTNILFAILNWDLISIQGGVSLTDGQRTRCCIFLNIQETSSEYKYLLLNNAFSVIVYSYCALSGTNTNELTPNLTRYSRRNFFSRQIKTPEAPSSFLFLSSPTPSTLT